MADVENPATLAACGVPEVSLAAGKIDPESKSPLHQLQARRLTRRCAISLAMALAIVPLLHGGAPDA